MFLKYHLNFVHFVETIFRNYEETTLIVIKYNGRAIQFKNNLRVATTTFSFSH